MRNIAIAASILLLSGVASLAAERGAKPFNPNPDWEKWNVDQRTDWASGYTKQSCPQMPPPTAAELAQKPLIAMASQQQVKDHIDKKCRNLPNKVAGKK